MKPDNKINRMAFLNKNKNVVSRTISYPLLKRVQLTDHLQESEGAGTSDALLQL